MSSKYQESGVSLERGYESVRRMKQHIVKTHNKGVVGSIGNFGGLFDLSKYEIKEPLLVSGTDGVGTKLLIAQEAQKHDTIGIDLVAMCVNDVITLGAQPLFFLDYIATGTVDPAVIEDIIKGISLGCIEAGCALIGGETAEMPDMYQPGHYDLAGYTTGVVEKSKQINNESISEGDILIGLPSSGIHSNGYSLVRKIFFKDHNYSLNDFIESLGCTLQEELLKPTAIYVKPVLKVLQTHTIKGMAHITGGGFIENIPRMLPESYGVVIEEATLTPPTIFAVMESLGQIEHAEMYNIFNMGIGMVLIVSKEDEESVLDILSEWQARTIGYVVSDPGVTIK